MQPLTYREGLKKHGGKLSELGDYHSPEDYLLSRAQIPAESVKEEARAALGEWRGRARVEAAASQVIRLESFAKARRIAHAMAVKLGEVGRPALSEKVEACFKTGRLMIWEEGKTFEPGSACGYAKLCPFHARIEAKRRLARYLDPVSSSADGGRIQFGTLTIRNANQGEYAEVAGRIWEAWGKLRRLKLWEPVTAAMVNLETTWTGSFNIHLHVLLAVPWGQDFNWGQIREAWHRLSGSEWVHFKPVEVKGLGLVYALKELVKYPAKFEARDDLNMDSPVDWDTQAGGGLLDMPLEAFAEWLDYIHGSRTMRTYGEWFNIPEPDPGEEPDRGELLGEFRWTSGAEGVDVFLIRVHNSAGLLGWAQATRKEKGSQESQEPP